ncbi:MAG: retron system putative HNH endonuclease [Verrucomicrobiota bacterium]|jgi:uncharacterized protein (TIGR02646 family)
MRQIQHGPNAPTELASTHVAEPNPVDPTASWAAFRGKQELRDDLWHRQKGRCAYCERCIPLASTPIEHIRPKSRFHEDTFCYHNLVLSCDTSSSCTNHKGNDWDDAFIPPTDSRCESWFYCDLNGLVGASDGLTGPDHDAVKLTIRMVNLNHPHLKTARETMLMTIEHACADMVGQLDAMRAFLAGELAENDHTKPFFSCKRQYFGSPA